MIAVPLKEVGGDGEEEAGDGGDGPADGAESDFFTKEHKVDGDEGEGGQRVDAEDL